jgi:hypothetical protein
MQMTEKNLDLAPVVNHAKIHAQHVTVMTKKMRDLIHAAIHAIHVMQMTEKNLDSAHAVNHAKIRAQHVTVMTKKMRDSMLAVNHATIHATVAAVIRKENLHLALVMIVVAMRENPREIAALNLADAARSTKGDFILSKSLLIQFEDMSDDASLNLQKPEK